MTDAASAIFAALSAVCLVLVVALITLGIAFVVRGLRRDG